MKIVVGFSRAKSKWAFGSKLIQLVEKRDYSHVFIRYTHPVSKVELVTQASHGMVHQTSFELFQEKNKVVKEYTFFIDTNKVAPLLTFIHQNIGKSYSQLQLVWIGVKKVLKIKIKTSNNDSAYICSELGARILEVLGILNTSDEDYITPSDLEKLILGK